MTHKETMNTHKLEMLKEAKRLVLSNGTNEIRLNDLRHDINLYNNFQKLRYHALIFKIRRGAWGITSHGWEFMRGEKSIPKYVWVENNKIQAHSQELVNVRDLNFGEPVIQEVFEYADGSRRPLASKGIDTRQAVLL